MDVLAFAAVEGARSDGDFVLRAAAHAGSGVAAASMHSSANHQVRALEFMVVQRS